MSFRFPVTTQEPLQVNDSEPLRTVRVRRFAHNAGGADFEDVLTVPPGYKWRIISVTGTLYPGVVANQLTELVIRSDATDGEGNIIYDCWSMWCGAALFRIFGLWTMGGASEVVNLGDYQQYQHAIPDVWIPENYRVSIFGRNVNALDTSLYYVAYEQVNANV